jgi:hypothetical protein
MVNAFVIYNEPEKLVACGKINFGMKVLSSTFIYLCMLFKESHVRLDKNASSLGEKRLEFLRAQLKWSFKKILE